MAVFRFATRAGSQAHVRGAPAAILPSIPAGSVAARAECRGVAGVRRFCRAHAGTEEGGGRLERPLPCRAEFWHGPLFFVLCRHPQASMLVSLMDGATCTQFEHGERLWLRGTAAAVAPSLVAMVGFMTLACFHVRCTWLFFSLLCILPLPRAGTRRAVRLSAAPAGACRKRPARCRKRCRGAGDALE